MRNIAVVLGENEKNLWKRYNFTDITHKVLRRELLTLHIFVCTKLTANFKLKAFYSVQDVEIPFRHNIFALKFMKFIKT